MEIDTLTIGDAKKAIEHGRAVAQSLGVKDTALSSQPRISGLHIVILDRGFVYVGDVSVDGDWMLISNAKNVRRWGTTRGLGELAAKGPQAETQLDMGGEIKSPLRAVIGIIACEATAWKR